MDDDIRDRFRGISRGARDNAPMYQPRTSVPPRREPTPPNPKPEPPKPTPPKPPKAKKHRRKRSKKTKLLILLFVILLVAGGAGYALYINKYANKPAQQIEAPQVIKTEEPKLTGTIRFVAVGDSWAFESINNAAKQPDGSYNYAPMMSAFKPFFDKSDIRLCNQITSGGGGDISGYPSFNAPPAWSSGFAVAGCNLINLASDHMNDKSQPAIDATRTTWDAAQNVLAVAGANRSAEEQAKISYFSVKGLKFAYLAYTTNTLNKQATPFGVNLYSDELAGKQIAEARKNAKMVIVSMHWGVEDSLDINADQDRIGQFLATQNVDVVVGSGPRVPQPVKVLGGANGHQTLVWFSLGNFLNSQLPINNLFGGVAVMDIDAATLKIKAPKLMPVYMHYEWTAAQKAAGNVNARHDFKLFPLDLAAEALAKSQNNTTVEAQTTRITDIINKFTPIQVIKSTEF